MNELEIIRYPQIEGLSAFFNTIDYRTSHLHTEWELIWVMDQPLAVTCGQNSFLVQPGQLILFNPNEPHEFRKTDKSCTFLCLQISAAILPVGDRLHVDDCLPHRYLSDEELEGVKRQIGDIMRAYLLQEEHYALYCVGQCCLLLHRLFSAMPAHILSPEQMASMDKRNARLKRLIRFVDQNYMGKIRLSDFAEAEGCSMSYLSHFIKDTMNQTFQEYVTSVRVNCACKLMAAGGMRMLEICMESGFSDYRYFSKAFRKQYNMTPEEFSRRSREEKRDDIAIHRSIHSVERFYTRKDSLIILDHFAD